MDHNELLDYYENLTYQEFFNFSIHVVDSYRKHISIKRTYKLPLSREEEIIQEFLFKQQERTSLENILDGKESNESI